MKTVRSQIEVEKEKSLEEANFLDCGRRGVLVKLGA